MEPSYIHRQVHLKNLHKNWESRLKGQDHTRHGKMEKQKEAIEKMVKQYITEKYLQEKKI